MEKLNKIRSFLEQEHISYHAESLEKDQSLLEDSNSPIIKILSLFGAQLICGLVLGLLLITGLIEHKESQLTVGILSLSLALCIDIRNKTFVISSITMTAYIIGLLMINIAFASMNMSVEFAAGISMLITLISLLIRSSYLISLIAFISFNIATLLLLRHALIPYHETLLISTLIIWLYLWFIYEADIIFKLKRFASLYDPIKIGLILCILTFYFLSDLRYNPLYDGMQVHYILVESGVAILGILLLSYRLFGLFEVESIFYRLILLLILFFSLIATVYFPGISISLLIILLCFKNSFKTGLFLGIGSFIYFISRFYYDLSYSLMIKSFILIGSGLFLLLLYYVLRQNFKNEKI